MTSSGQLSCAEVAGPPSPLKPPVPFPATVVMIPLVDMRRTTRLLLSARYRFPDLSKVTPAGWFTLANDASPLSPE